MVVMDATVLMLLFHSDAPAPTDASSGQPLSKCQERVEYLMQRLSEAGTRILIPTPVLSEILVVSGLRRAEILNEIHNAYAFSIQPFDEMAAVEVAMMTESDGKSGRSLTSEETKAKVKYDRQIIAIAVVNEVQTIYSDDRGLARKAAAKGIDVVTTGDLPLPPEPPQAVLPLGEPGDA